MTKTLNLTEKLKQYFGFDTFKGDQEAIIRNLLDGNDSFVVRVFVTNFRPSLWMELQLLYRP